MNRFKIRFKGMLGVLTISLIFALAQTCGLAATAAKKVIGKEMIREFSGGKLCKVQYANNTLEDVIIYDTGEMVTYDPDKHGKLFKKANKISDRLQAILDKSEKNAVVPVSIWISDLDYMAIDKEVKKELQIDDLSKASKEKIEAYIIKKRAAAKKEYTVKNKKFFTKYVTEDVVLFTAGYAPVVIAKLDVNTIAKIAKDDAVLSIDYFVDDKKVEDTTYSIPNINANYTKNLGYTGSGVKVGVLETGYCDKTNTQLSDRNITFDVTDTYASSHLSTHATIVTGILVGNTQGIAPGAAVYVAAGLSRLQDYQKIEWLIDQGVKVINYSAGYTSNAGTYSDMAKWIDHLGMQHNVHFVKSAGNVASSSYLITDPGMAYNALVTGSIYDANSTNEPYWNDDVFSSFSRYTETSGGYKPDLTAPGQGIDVAGYTNNSGTSFAAPHAAGVLTQLLHYRSNLSGNNALLKAILAAGTNHKTATDYGSAYSLSPNFSDKEGVGVIDAKAAYNIVSSSTYADLELTEAQFPYNISFTVSQTGIPVRVSLAWLKQNTISAASHPGAAVTERALSDLDLAVYNPSGIAVGSSVSGTNNLELVQFTPSVTGTYQIRINGYSIQNTSEKIGVAWYQAPN